MEKPAKTETCIIIAVTALVFFAWLCRMTGFPWEDGGSNLIRGIIYPALLIFWIFTLHHRLTHPQIRHLAISLGLMLLVWFLLRIVKYSLPDQMFTPVRYLWYLYYMPMLFVPTLALLTAFSIGLPESHRLPKKYGLFWIPAAVLFLLVLTNDLHQLVFSFPDTGVPWTDKNDSYAFVYNIIAVYIFICNLAVFIILAVKSRYPKSRRRIFLPLIPIFLLIGYWAAYTITGSSGWVKLFFGDMTAVACVLYAASFELCIRCGMIRSNTGYNELFRAGKPGAQIADHSHVIRLSSADSLELTKEETLDALEGPVFLNKHMLLKSKEIHFGHVLWQEDVSELAEAIEEIEENNRDLNERNHIAMERLEAEKSLLSLQEKNRAADLLQRETAGQLSLIDSLLDRYESETGEEERRKLLAGAAVAGAYIKRYGNLLLVCERSEEADMADLARCFEESFNNLDLLDVECLASLPPEYILKTKDMLRIYRSFETIIEGDLFTLQHIWVNGREKDGRIVLNIDIVCDADLSRHAGLADAFSYDSGTFRFTFCPEKGGADK